MKAIVFDAFGTLVHIRKPRRPYRKLMRYLADQGMHVDHVSGCVMSHPWSLRDIPDQLGCVVPEGIMRALEEDLQVEVESIQVYPEVDRLLSSLASRGLKLGLCSNLALPYCEPVQRLLPGMGCYALSCRVGAVKPQRMVYEHVAAGLGVQPHEILFVGDTYLADVQGPREAGMNALHLNRSAGMTLDRLLAHMVVSPRPTTP